MVRPMEKRMVDPAGASIYAMRLPGGTGIRKRPSPIYVKSVIGSMLNEGSLYGPAAVFCFFHRDAFALAVQLQLACFWRPDIYISHNFILTRRDTGNWCNTVFRSWLPLAISSPVKQFFHLPSGNSIVVSLHSLFRCNIKRGTITIASGALTSGTYQYSLLINGKIIETKQLVIQK